MENDGKGWKRMEKDGKGWKRMENDPFIDDLPYVTPVHY